MHLFSHKNKRDKQTAEQQNRTLIETESVRVALRQLKLQPDVEKWRCLAFGELPTRSPDGGTDLNVHLSNIRQRCVTRESAVCQCHHGSVFILSRDRRFVLKSGNL